jgi:hypothetical protein
MRSLNAQSISFRSNTLQVWIDELTKTLDETAFSALLEGTVSTLCVDCRAITSHARPARAQYVKLRILFFDPT